MKKNFLAIITLLLPLKMMGVGETIEVNGIWYELLARNIAKVTRSPNGYSGDIVIPDEIQYEGKTYSVNSILSHRESDWGGGIIDYHKGAFEDCKDLISVTIGNNIETINAGAFAGCENLKKISFGKSINQIYQAFEYFQGREGTYYSTMPLFKDCHNITDIYMYGSIPKFKDYRNGIVFFPDDYDFFDNDDDYKNVTLHVKDIFIEQYKNSKAWSNFGDIVVLEKVTDFNLIYYVDGEIYKSYQYKYGDEIMPEPEPQKEGYTFSGWTDIPETMPGKNVKVNGYFTANRHKCTYIIDGEVYKEYEMEYGSTISKEKEPAKEGYTFSGWSGIPDTMPDNDVTITGSFVPNVYSLTYVIGEDVYKVYDVRYNEEISPEPSPQKKGMDFSGWKSLPTTMPAKDVRVTGSYSWSRKTIDNVVYQVTDTISNYCSVMDNDDANGEIRIAPSVDFDFSYSVSAIYNRAFYGKKAISLIEIPEMVTSIGERAFANIDKLNDVYCYAEEVPNTDRTAFENSYTDNYVTLHVPGPSIDKYKSAAPWKNFKEIVAIDGTQVTHTITYYVDGEVYKTMELDEGETVNPEEIPTKEGYTFSGWEGQPETMPDNDVTVTGTFTINSYTLTYYLDGEAYKTYNLDYGTQISQEDYPEKEGYTFSGWGNVPQTMPAGDVTLYGSFAVNTYQLIFMVDGEVYKTVEVEYGAMLPTETEPTKDGCEFSGWSWMPSKMPAEDVVVSGTFTKIRYEEMGCIYEIEDGQAVLVSGENISNVIIDPVVIINNCQYNMTTIGEGAFNGYNNIQSVVIPDGIEVIYADAFNGCGNLGSISLGKDIEYIGTRAFANIFQISGARRRSGNGPLIVECHAEAVPYIYYDSFSGAPVENAILKVNDELVDSYKASSIWNRFGTIIGFNEATAIRSIGDESQGAVVFSIDGRRIDRPQKGLNIIRTGRGIRKVAVK